jgi:hypothetical protein
VISVSLPLIGELGQLELGVLYRYTVSRDWALFAKKDPSAETEAVAPRARPSAADFYRKSGPWRERRLPPPA